MSDLGGRRLLVGSRRGVGGSGVNPFERCGSKVAGVIH